MNLKKISKNELGALENTTPLFGRNEKGASLKQLLLGRTLSPFWVSVSYDEMCDPNYSAVVLFADYINMANFITKPRAVHISNSIHVAKKKFSVTASIVGVYMDGYVFLRDRYPIENFECNEMETVDTLKNRTGVYENCFIRGFFDVTMCSYYCNFDV